MIALSLLFSLILIHQTLRLHSCVKNGLSPMCNQMYKSNALPQDTAYIVTMITPLTYQMVRRVGWPTILACWCMCTFSIFFSVIQAELLASVGFLAFSTVFSLMALVDHHRQSLLVYVGHKHQEHLVEAVRYEEKKIAEAKLLENSAIEMRHMIAKKTLRR